MALGVFASLLNLISTHYVYHDMGRPTLKALLQPNAVRQLNGYLNSSQTELVLVTLKLFNAMSNFGGSIERKSVMEAFHWGNKVFLPLFWK